MSEEDDQETGHRADLGIDVLESRARELSHGDSGEGRLLGGCGEIRGWFSSRL